MSQQSQLFIGNLSFKLSEEDLKATFSEFGTVLEVKLPLERGTTKKRGFGFVTFETPEQAQAAIDGLNGKEISGREIRINFAEKSR